MLKSALRRTASQPLGLASARAYKKVVGFYKQAELPPLSLKIDVEDERWVALREKSKRLLAPHPTGLSTQKFLEALRRDFGIALGAGLTEDKKIVRALSRKMPDIAYVPENDAGALQRKMTVKLVYPAYYANLKRGPRIAADYDESTPMGAAAFRQLKGVVTYLLDVHPRGLIRDTFCNLLMTQYSHRLYDFRADDYEFARSLVDRMPDIAVWKVSNEYRAYDAIRRTAPPPGPPRPSSVRYVPVAGRGKSTIHNHQARKIDARATKRYFGPANLERDSHYLYFAPGHVRSSGWAAILLLDSLIVIEIDVCLHA